MGCWQPNLLTRCPIFFRLLHLWKIWVDLATGRGILTFQAGKSIYSIDQVRLWKQILRCWHLLQKSPDLTSNGQMHLQNLRLQLHEVWFLEILLFGINNWMQEDTNWYKYVVYMYTCIEYIYIYMISISLISVFSTLQVKIAQMFSFNLNFFAPECSAETPYITKWIGYLVPCTRICKNESVIVELHTTAKWSKTRDAHHGIFHDWLIRHTCFGQKR